MLATFALKGSSYARESESKEMLCSCGTLPAARRGRLLLEGLVVVR